MSIKQLRQFNLEKYKNDLLHWYDENKRDLPWRQTRDPYFIWISEIMLQQTQVITVIPYYERFLKKFPTIFHLAQADEQSVLKEWEGLGYYSRARNLHEAAKEVVKSYGGVVPSDKKQLSSLKGIGPYTSGAILSIAFNKPEPAVDGNVMRVLSRVLLINDNITEMKTRRKFEAIVRKIICKEDPSSFNQGLMELGALICTPKSPLCLHCPVRESCRAFESGMQEELPVRTRPNKQKVKQYSVVIIKNAKDALLIEKRPDSGLLANMWQFPMINKLDYDGKKELEQYIFEKYNLLATLGKQLGYIKHVFSHKIWELTVYEMTTVTPSDSNNIQPAIYSQNNMKREKELHQKSKTKGKEIFVPSELKLKLALHKKQNSFIQEESTNKQNQFHMKNIKDPIESRKNFQFETLENLSSYPFSVAHLKVRELLKVALNH